METYSIQVINENVVKTTIDNSDKNFIVEDEVVYTINKDNISYRLIKYIGNIKELLVELKLDYNVETIQFKDENLYKYMKEYLNTRYSIIESYNDETKEIVVSKEKLLKVDLINIEGKGIKDLTGIEKFTNLSHLYASNNQIESIEPLKDLTKITFLLLSNNKVKNISTLEKLVNITELQLENNQIENIEALRNLNKLDRAFLRNNKIMDIEPVINLSNVTLLVINNNVYIENKKAITILKSEKVEIELPTIFKYSQKEGSLIYTKEGLELTNCKIENNKIILETSQIGEQIATIEIKDGNAAQTTYKIEYRVSDNSNILKNESIYKIEDEICIANISPETSIDEFKKNIKEDYRVEVYAEAKEVTTGNIGTGMTIKISKGTEEKEYTAVVTGDTTGDGKVKAQDLIAAVKQYKFTRASGAKGEKIEGAKLKAIKYTKSENYTTSDLVGQVKMYKKYRKNS